MPGLAGSEIGQHMAQDIGNAVYTGVSTVNGEQVVDGTNAHGSVSATVEVTSSGSFSGSFTLGKEGVFSGTLGAENGESKTGTYNMSIAWETKITDEGFLRLSYTVGVGAELRQGSILLPIRADYLKSNHTPPKPDSDSTDKEDNDYNHDNDYNYDFENESADYDKVSEGAIILHDIEYLDYYYIDWSEYDRGDWHNEEE